MREVRCERTDLLVPECAHCRGAAQDQYARARRERLLGEPGVILARFPGTCGGCGEHVKEGDPIRRNPDGPGWIAECCMEGP